MQKTAQKITTFLTFNDQAEAAAAFYCSLFDGKITSTMPGPGGTVMAVNFELFGQGFIAMNGGPTFTFGNGTSLFVSCEDQAEIDRYWEKLGDGGTEINCGWITDRFGVTWQIIPKNLPALLEGGRAVPAMLKMKKLEIAALERARDAKPGAPSSV